jgi:hypothetical protein
LTYNNARSIREELSSGLLESSEKLVRGSLSRSKMSVSRNFKNFKIAQEERQQPSTSKRLQRRSA